MRGRGWAGNDHHGEGAGCGLWIRGHAVGAGELVVFQCPERGTWDHRAELKLRMCRTSVVQDLHASVSRRCGVCRACLLPSFCKFVPGLQSGPTRLVKNSRGGQMNGQTGTQAEPRSPG